MYKIFKYSLTIFIGGILMSACDTPTQNALPVSQAESQPVAPKNFAGDWTTYFYINQPIADIPQYIQWMDDEKMLVEYPSAFSPICGFLGQVFSDNPGDVTHWVKNANVSKEMGELLQCALWFSGDTELIQSLPGDLALLENNAPDLVDIDISSPSDLDVLWGAFMASGDPKYPDRLIDFSVSDQQANFEDDVTYFLTQSSAEWSIASNALQHEIVRRSVENKINELAGPQKEKLETILEQINSGRNQFGSQSGEFSAKLVVIDQDNVEEFEKPSFSPPVLAPVSSAKIGDIVAVKLLFTGLGLSESLHSNVTFDLKVVAPDGSIYSGADFKNLKALEGRTPVRFNIFNNQTTPMLRFEPKDQPGDYKISAVVYDNIGNQAVELNEIIRVQAG